LVIRVYLHPAAGYYAKSNSGGTFKNRFPHNPLLNSFFRIPYGILVNGWVDDCVIPKLLPPDNGGKFQPAEGLNSGYCIAQLPEKVFI